MKKLYAFTTLITSVLLLLQGCGGGSGGSSENVEIEVEDKVYGRFDSEGYINNKVSNASLTGTWLVIGEEHLVVDVPFLSIRDDRMESFRATLSVVDHMDGTLTIADCLRSELLTRTVPIDSANQSFSFDSGSLETQAGITSNTELQISRIWNSEYVVSSGTTAVAYKMTDETFLTDIGASTLGRLKLLGTENNVEVINIDLNLVCIRDERHIVDRVLYGEASSFVVDTLEGTAMDSSGKVSQFEIVHNVDGLSPELDIYYEGIWGFQGLDEQDFSLSEVNYVSNTALTSTTVAETGNKSANVEINVDIADFF